MKKNNTPTKGIVIIGGGQNYYGRLAINLAASIRRQDKKIPIIIYNTPGLLYDRIWQETREKLKVEVIPLPYESYEGGNFLKAKLHFYDLSPFDRTICLDADMLWMGGYTPETLFTQLEGIKFTMSNEGYIDVRTGEVNTTQIYTQWAGWDDIATKYGSKLGDKYYQLRSEFIYFEKCAEVRRLFAEAKKIYAKPLVRVIKMGGHFADEFAFNLASSITGLYPHHDKWTPAFWSFREMKLTHQHKSPTEVIGQYALLSIGGNRTIDSTMKFYNGQCETCFSLLGLKGFEKIRNKAQVLPERKDI